jgi:hypothetical protein
VSIDTQPCSRPHGEQPIQAWPLPSVLFVS